MNKAVQVAEILFRENKFQAVINTCHQILSEDNNSIEAIKLIAKSFLATRKIDSARLYFNKALEINPDDYESIKDLGNTYHAVGDSNSAKNYYQKAIEINNDYAQALTNLGSIEIISGNKEKALSLLIKATESNPKLAHAWGNLSNGYLQLGKSQEAEVSIRKSIELNPNLFNSHFLLGTILLEQKKIQKAEQSLRRSIELNPNLFNSHFLLGTILLEQKKFQEAESSLSKAIQINPDSAAAHSSLGIILKELGKSKEAESSLRKAIQINPDNAGAHSNLGIILKELGKLREAESSLRKAIEINEDISSCYYSLSTFKYSKNQEKWKNKLFSKNILENKSKKDKVDLYFARANILHNQKNYKESSEYLKLANELKLFLKSSNYEHLINKTKVLKNECHNNAINIKDQEKYPQSIFIVGMPRSGSTLLESILSMNMNVNDLGETNILEISIREWNKVHNKISLAEIFFKKIAAQKNEVGIITNKLLYNYQYAGIIATQIPNAKIIHCFRNPLDNILSIYKAHFTNSNEYSSSLVDCAKVYLDQESVMTEYKNRFRTNIYDLNYDSLVTNPNQEIKSLISWLGWKWQDSFLTPHLNPRSVSTASNIQVRFPINSKSIGGWKNYREMLKPAIAILSDTDRYRDICSEKYFHN